MGETITLKSAFDGFELSAYLARPTDARRGGLVVRRDRPRDRLPPRVERRVLRGDEPPEDLLDVVR